MTNTQQLSLMDAYILAAGYLLDDDFSQYAGRIQEHMVPEDAQVLLDIQAEIIDKGQVENPSVYFAKIGAGNEQGARRMAEKAKALAPVLDSMPAATTSDGDAVVALTAADLSTVEHEVIATILSGATVPYVTPSYFTNLGYSKIVGFLESKLKNFEPITPAIAREAIAESGVIGLTYEKATRGALTDTDAIKSSFSALKRRYMERQQLSALSAISATLAAPTSTIESKADEIKEIISQLDDGENDYKTMDFGSAYQEYTEYDPHASSFWLGNPDLDSRVKGLAPGTITIIAGGPGAGKSILGFDCQRFNALVGGHSSVYYMLEMNSIDYASRHISAAASIQSQSVFYKTATNDHNKRERFDAAVDALQGIRDRMLFVPCAGATVGWLVASMTKAKKLYGTSLFIIDYFGLIQDESRNWGGGGQAAKSAHIIRKLRDVVSKLDVTLVLLSQLNREGRKQVAPSLHNLSETAGLEQAANTVILLWEEDEDAEIFGYNIAKNRRGTQGIGSMLREGAYQRFSDAAILYTEDGKRAPRLCLDLYSSMVMAKQIDTLVEDDDGNPSVSSNMSILKKQSTELTG